MAKGLDGVHLQPCGIIASRIGLEDNRSGTKH